MVKNVTITVEVELEFEVFARVGKGERSHIGTVTNTITGSSPEAITNSVQRSLKSVAAMGSMNV